MESKTLTSETVHTLSKMIKDLEEQLDRMLAINEASDKELQSERKRRADLERALESQKEHLRSQEQEVATVEELQAEVSHLQSERSRLAANIEELGRQISEAEQERRVQTRLVERLRAERDDVLEELQTLEAQFNRAMEMVSDLRTRLAVLGEERDAFKGRLKVMDEKLRNTEEERGALLAEVEESRRALEEIRRSLADACALPERWSEQ